MDHANDIHLAETVSLVPGEEGMSPLFMDGTGHGNSVAGLIAAEENGEGITGVAPGELVRSTGVLGEEIVSSGTSLAAPQVAGVAALIWEKDPDMPADFVRALLNESANGYGDQEQYGNGLVDARYALEHYEEFKKKYKKNKETKLEENKEKVLSFEDTGCVEGSWATDDHGDMIPSGRINVQKGARFNDLKEDRYVEHYGKTKNDNIYTFRGMIDNPWWHGYQKTNYVAAYIYETKLANQMQYGGKRIRSGSIWCINRRMPIRKGRITPLPIRQKHIRSDGRMPEGQSMERCVSTKRQSIRRGRTMSFGMSRILIHNGWEISMRM